MDDNSVCRDSCERNQYWDPGPAGGNGKCMDCPSSQPLSPRGSSNEASCTSCPAGLYLTVKSAASSEACNPCPAGTYGTAINSRFCVACPTDTKCPAGSSSPIETVVPQLSQYFKQPQADFKKDLYLHQPSVNHLMDEAQSRTRDMQIYVGLSFGVAALGISMLILAVVKFNILPVQKLHSIDVFPRDHYRSSRQMFAVGTVQVNDHAPGSCSLIASLQELVALLYENTVLGGDCSGSLKHLSDSTLCRACHHHVLCDVVWCYGCVCFTLFHVQLHGHADIRPLRCC